MSSKKGGTANEKWIFLPSLVKLQLYLNFGGMYE